MKKYNNNNLRGITLKPSDIDESTVRYYTRYIRHLASTLVNESQEYQSWTDYIEFRKMIDDPGYCSLRICMDITDAEIQNAKQLRLKLKSA